MIDIISESEKSSNNPLLFVCKYRFKPLPAGGFFLGYVMKNFIETFINPLDTSKYYIVGVSGTGFVSEKIKELSQCSIPQKERWSHVAAFHNGEIIESHFKTRGVHKAKFADWFKGLKEGERVEAFEYNLDWNILKTYAHLRVLYGTGDIKSIYKHVRLDTWEKIVGVDKDSKGVTCSELLAEVELISEKQNNILQLLDIPFDWMVKPTDWQILAQKKELQIICLKGGCNE